MTKRNFDQPATKKRRRSLLNSYLRTSTKTDSDATNNSSDNHEQKSTTAEPHSSPQTVSALSPAKPVMKLATPAKPLTLPDAKPSKQLKSSRTSAQTSRVSSSSAAVKNHHRQVRQLSDLETLLANSPLPAKPASDIKQLGSIQSLLRGQPSRITAISDDDNSAINAAPTYQKEFARHKENSSLLDTEAFNVDDAKTDDPTPLQNIRFLAVTIFGIGACVFGINQLIQDANYNFAAENDTDNQQQAVVPPRIMTFQGRLTDVDDQSITETKRMQFTMYNTSGGNTPPPIGGDVLWDSNSCYILPNSSGIFTVNLGAGKGDGEDDYNCGATLGNIFAQNSSVWLQITVDDEVLFPRQIVKSVPYALNSETLQGYEASTAATANTIPVVDSSGNLNFATDNTSIANLGRLNLVSENGDIYLLPGSGTVYIGDVDRSANLFVTGEATISGGLAINNAQITATDETLTFRSSAGQSALADLSLTKDGYLGLGTTTPNQKLTLNQGSIAFNYLAAPTISNLKLSEDIADASALRRIDSPNRAVQLQERSENQGLLAAGTYQYAYTFVTSDGTQTALSPISSFTLENDGKSVLISNLATSSHPSVVARNLYRSRAGDDTLYFVKTIPDNVSTSTFDTLADNELKQAQEYNTTGNYRYKVTFVTAQGETNPSIASKPIKVSGDGRRIKIENLPVGTTEVSARNLYRSLADSDQYYLVATINDNTTTIVYDNLSDQVLATKKHMPEGGSIYTNGKLSLKFEENGAVTAGDLVSTGRLEATYGDNQGLKLPTSAGKPFAKVGQQVGDIVYDSVGQILYIYNGSDFVAAGGSVAQSSLSTELASNSNCTNNSCRIVLDAEYPGAVLTGDGSNNNGTLTSGHETVQGNYHFNYYQWQVDNPDTLNDFDTTVNLTLPNNFTSWAQNGLTLDFATTSTSELENNLSLEVLRSGTSLTISKSNLTSSTPGSWMSHVLDRTPAAISGEELASLGFKAGDTLTIKIKTASLGGNSVKIGQINVNYLTDRTSAPSAKSLWQQVSGALFPSTRDDIILGGDSTASAKIGFFNLDGQGTPTLYVRGNIFLDSDDKKNYLDLAERSSFNIRTLGSDGTKTERLTITPDGNIGIGTTTPSEKLEVDGNIKVNGSLQLDSLTTSQAGECNAQSEGKIYYNGDLQIFYACKAANDARTTFIWTPLNN